MDKHTQQPTPKPITKARTIIELTEEPNKPTQSLRLQEKLMQNKQPINLSHAEKELRELHEKNFPKAIETNALEELYAEVSDEKLLDNLSEKVVEKISDNDSNNPTKNISASVKYIAQTALQTIAEIALQKVFTFFKKKFF